MTDNLNDLAGEVEAVRDKLVMDLYEADYKEIAEIAVAALAPTLRAAKLLLPLAAALNESTAKQDERIAELEEALSKAIKRCYGKTNGVRCFEVADMWKCDECKTALALLDGEEKP